MPETFPRPYKPGPIEPIVDVGQQLLIINQQGGYDLYKTAFIEPIGKSFPYIINLGAIVAGAVTAITPLLTMAPVFMQYGQLAQFRGRVLDDIWVDLLQPQGVARFGTLSVNANLNAYGALNEPEAESTEVYVFEQRPFFLRATNPLPVNLAQARVRFWGFKYILAGAEGPSANAGQIPPLKHFSTINEALASGEKFTAVPIAGWSGQ